MRSYKINESNNSFHTNKTWMLLLPWAKTDKRSTTHVTQEAHETWGLLKSNISLLLWAFQMAYVPEVKLGGCRGSWSGVTPSSCPEVDLEVIEEYLQEHSLEVQPAHTPTTSMTANMGHQMHAHSHQDASIIGWLNAGSRRGILKCFFRIFYLTEYFSLLSSENSWSGQHAYEWRYGSHSPHEEYKEPTPHSAWQSSQGQWVSK